MWAGSGLLLRATQHLLMKHIGVNLWGGADAGVAEEARVLEQLAARARQSQQA